MLGTRAKDALNYPNFNVAVTENTLSLNNLGLYIGMSTGISNNNTFIKNNQGILVDSSVHAEIAGNLISNSSESGIEINARGQTWFNNILSLTGNLLCFNKYGIYIKYGMGTINNNTIVNNLFGFYANEASALFDIYWNNFTDNLYQASTSPQDSGIKFDAGYPKGGNYWSDCNNTDQYSGPYQNESGKDNICDTPIHGDNYPLVGVRSTVVTPEKVWRTLSISTSNSSTLVNGYVTIQGLLFPAKADVNVSIWCKYLSYGVWTIIANTITDSGGNYHLQWLFSETDPQFVAGLHYFKVSVLNDRYTMSIENGTVEVDYQPIPSTISISVGSPSTRLGNAVNIKGILKGIEGKALSGETVMLSYTFAGLNSWTLIMSHTTDYQGNYQVSWLPTATGNYLIKAEWNGDVAHSSITNMTMLSSYAYGDYVFFVESNSSVQDLAFDSQSKVLTFSVNGTEGTHGCVNVLVAKSLVSDINNLKVTLDDSIYDYAVSDFGDAWRISLTYQLSAHVFAIKFMDSWLISNWPIIVGGIVVAIASLSLFVFARSKRSARAIVRP